jgi:two-component system sensor histidine kinase EvgS
MLKVDRVQLKRILSNLISNAFKYTEAGSVEVRVTGGTQESGMSEIVVEDTGLGMTQEQIGKLFTPFTRFHTERAEGIGLGLALTKSLVELNDGTILVSSQAGSGTSCSLTFPCVSEEQLSASGISNHFEKRGTSISSLLPQFVALIVDDDRDSVDSLARVLSTRGISVQRAYSVSQARRVLAETSIGIIITDFRMPDGGLSALLQPMPERLMPPYVVLTGEAHLQLPAEYSPAAILSKPVDVAILMEVISSVREGTLPLARVA